MSVFDLLLKIKIDSRAPLLDFDTLYSAVLDELQRCGFSEDDARSAIVGKEDLQIFPLFCAHHFHPVSVSADKDACIDWLVVHCPSGALSDMCAACGECTNPLSQSVCLSSVQAIFLYSLSSIRHVVTCPPGTGAAKAAHSRHVPGPWLAEWS